MNALLHRIKSVGFLYPINSIKRASVKDLSVTRMTNDVHEHIKHDNVYLHYMNLTSGAGQG